MLKRQAKLLLNIVIKLLFEQDGFAWVWPSKVSDNSRSDQKWSLNWWVVVAAVVVVVVVAFFWGMVDRQIAFTPYFQLVPLPEVLTIANLRHAASKIWTCAESDFRLCWMKLCYSDFLKSLKEISWIFFIYPSRSSKVFPKGR